MTTSPLQDNLFTSSLQTSPNEGIGKTKKITNPSTSSICWSKKSPSNSSMVLPNKKFRTVLIGQHRIKFYCKTCMMDRLTNLNASNNITEHTILSKELTEKVSNQFVKEIQELNEIVKSLGKKLNNETDPSKKIAIYDALKEINGFITRYQNTGLGGFDKVKASEIATSEPLFKNLPKVLKNETSDYKAAKQNLENAKKENPKSEEKINQLQTQIEEHETKYENAIKEGTLSAQKTVAENLEKLTTFLTSSPNSSSKIGNTGTNIEKTFNILQANAMSGWIINDIVPKLENVDKACGTTLANHLKPEGDSQILNKIQNLNNTTRTLPMFSEIKLDSLLEDTKVKASETVNKMIEEYKTKKIGIRGRSEQEPKPKTARIPLKENLQGDLANDPGLTNGFSPKPTCSRDAVPKDFVNQLNEFSRSLYTEYSEAAEVVLEWLKEKTIVEKRDNGTYESVQSFGGIIDDAGLPTYCSVSGTTTELLACLYYKADENTQTQMNNAFKFLLDIAKGENKNVTIPNDFVKIFTPIALFMEAGRFHTSAEVLGGMYGTAVAWANVQAENSESKDMNDMIDGFKNILNFYKGHMNEFWGQVFQPQLQVQPQN
ncbi:MAG: hypothetical protein ACLRFH_04600 [Opitutales bacterium]